MRRTITRIAGREFYANKKLTISHLPVIMILVAVAMLTGGALPPARILIISFALNLFFVMVYFMNVYLQQSKDKELQYLASLPIERREIIIGKILYIGLVSFLFNLLIQALFLTTTGNFLISINALFLNTFIAMLLGMTILTLFIFSSFEKLMHHSQYMRAIIIFAFIGMVYFWRIDLTALGDSLTYNPVVPIVLYGLVVYVYYKLMVMAFLKKKSYL